VRRGGVGADFDDGRHAGNIAVAHPDNINVSECFAGFTAIAAGALGRSRDAPGDDDVRGRYGTLVRTDG
jgi:hypothetical protein